jgi:sulfite reductase (ferredoxin)
MSKAGSEYRLDGIYKQRQDGFYMQRIKLAAGAISSGQASIVAAISTRFGLGTIHLTTRGSMEIHWLKEEDLPQIKRELAKSGLTSRGACGGAVRGITCGSQGAQGFPVLEMLARRLHRHFTGNPRFERLPKKFKIGIEADVVGGRHLIQDVGLVLASLEDGRARYDVWIAGGLGREPQAGFLFAENVTEERLIPVIEAIVRVYAAHAPPPKRLKFLANTFGEVKLRQLIEAEPSYLEEIPAVSGLPENLVAESAGREHLELPVFAGKLTSVQLEQIADAAERYADGVLMVTANQDIALLLSPGVDSAAELTRLQLSTGLTPNVHTPALRVCPGSHECQMGLAATRDVAHELLGHIGERGQNLIWAVSGCFNSCSQPQLADVGIVASGLVAGADGQKTPRFDVYRRSGEGLGQKVHSGLTKDELVNALKKIN